MRWTLLFLFAAGGGSNAGAGLAYAGVASHPGVSSPIAHAKANPRSNPLAQVQFKFTGMKLVVPSRRIDLPKGAIGRVRAVLQMGGREATAEEMSRTVPADAELVGTLSGPGMSALEIRGTLSSGLLLPPMGDQGDYTLSGIRLVSGQRILLESEPRTVAIRSLGDVLVAQVTSSPMTLQELKEAGVQLGQGNYEGRQFTLGLTIGSQQVELKVPVAIPDPRTVADPSNTPTYGRPRILGWDPQRFGDAPEISLLAADIKPSMNPFTMSRPALARRLDSGLKAFIVIPGSIGYMHQFFKVDLTVVNVLPDAAPFMATHLSSTLNLPGGLDQQTGTDDDPLRLARRDGVTDNAVQAILGPDGQGRIGKGQDQLAPGESGLATYIVEGLKEGAHELNFQIQGQFEGSGLDVPVPLFGKATAKVLVKNPDFNVVMIHPDVVRKGEVYTLEARVTNQSATLVNGMSVSLDLARLAGVKLVSDPVAIVPTLQPGETHSFLFQLRALHNGAVQSSFLSLEGGTSGFQLCTGLGERNIRLNPDTLNLPPTLSVLPESFREAMLKLLGEAYAVATSKGDLPPGVLPIQLGTVTGGLAQELTQQGLFLNMGVDRARIWWALWQAFTRNADQGFDQLMRTTRAGQDLRTAFIDLWSHWVDPDHPFSDRFQELAQWSDGSASLAMASLSANGDGLRVQVVDARGEVLKSGLGQDLDQSSAPGAAMAALQDQALIQVPLLQPGVRINLFNTTGALRLVEVQTLAPLLQGGSPTINHWPSLSIPAGGTASIALGANRGGTAEVSVEGGNPSTVYPAKVADLEPEPFQVLAVHRYDLALDPAASPFGTHVMVLFNRPNAALDVKEGEEGLQTFRAMVQLDGLGPRILNIPEDESAGQALPTPPAMVQAFPRGVSLFLDRPVGPYVPRTLTLAPTWADMNGHSIQGQLTWPIISSTTPGGAVVRGKVRKANGAAVPALLDYLYGFDPGGDSDISQYAMVASRIPVEADGTYQIDFMPEPAGKAVGPFALLASKGQDWALARGAVLGSGGAIETDIVFDGHGTVDGFVYDDQGRPIAGTAVALIQEDSGNRLGPVLGGSIQGAGAMGAGSVQGVLTTKEDGHFRFEGARAGIFSLQAVKGGFLACATGKIARDGETVSRNLLLRSGSVTIRARAMNEHGLPILDRYLFIAFMDRSDPNPGFKIVDKKAPDAFGWVQFDQVPAGDVKVLSEFTDEVVPPWVGYLGAGESQTITLQKRQPQSITWATVRLRVVDAHGQPVPGAYVFDTRHISYGQEPLAFATTGPDGRVEDQQVPAGWNYVATVRHPKWHMVPVNSAPLSPSADQTFDVVITLPPQARLEGRVTRPDGSPVKGALVAIPPVGPVKEANQLAITDEDGRYALSNVQTLGVARVAVVGPDLKTACNRNLAFLADASVQQDFVLPRVGNNELHGMVWQPAAANQGPQPAMAYVWAYAQLPDVQVPLDYGWPNPDWGLMKSTLVAQGTSDTSGRYRLGGLPVGAFTLKASNDFFPLEAVVTGDFGASADASLDQPITLVNGFAGEAHGTVYKKDGQTPVAKGLRVRFLKMDPADPAGPPASELTVLTQDGGKYQTPKVLSEGGYWIRVEDPMTGDIAMVSAQLRKGGFIQRDIRLWGRGKLTVHALDSQDHPLAEGSVTLGHEKSSLPLQPDDVPSLAENLDPASPGLMVFEDLLEGQVCVVVKNPSGRQGVAVARIPEGGGDREVTVHLEPLGAIRGRLKRSDGTYVKAGTVTATWDGKWAGVSTTRQEGVDGQFLLQSLPVGALRLEAFDPDSMETGRAYVTSRGDEEVNVEMQTQDKGRVVVRVLQEGAPVPGAQLSAQLDPSSGTYFYTDATTGADGQTEFFLPPGTFHLKATNLVNGAQGTLTLTRENGQAPLSLDLAIAPVRSALVTVLPPDGAPQGFALEGWNLAVEGLNRSLRLDANGQGLLRDLPVGTRNLTLSEGDRMRGRLAVEIAESGAAVQPFQWKADAIGLLHVQLQNADGSIHPNGLVTLDNGPRKVSSADGTALFTDVPQGIHTLYATSSDGLRSAYNNLVIIHNEGETVPAALAFQPAVRLQGTLRDETGAPVPYAPVKIQGVSVLVSIPDLVTDAQGRFLSGPLPLGTYLVTAKALNDVREGGVRVVADQPETTVQADVAYKGHGQVRVQVVSVTGAPLAGLNVALQINDGLLGTRAWSMTTDDQGWASYPDVLEGALKATAAYSGRFYEVTGTLAAGGILQLRIEARPTTRIAGRIRRHTDGAVWPQDSTVIIVGAKRYPMNLDGTVVDTEEEFTPSADLLKVQVALPDGSLLDVGQVAAVPNGITTVDLRAPAFTSLSGVVRNAAREPVAGAELRLDGRAVTQSNLDGGWRMPLVFPGQARITASRASSYASKDITIPEVDGTLVLGDLILSSSQVPLPISLQSSTTDLYYFTYTDGRFWSSSYEAAVNLAVDGGTAFTPTSASGLADWLEPSRRFRTVDQRQGVEITIVRSLSSFGNGLREEIQIRNIDSIPHQVSMTNRVMLSPYQELIGYPSNQPGLLRSPGQEDFGAQGWWGALLWGQGPEKPQSIDTGSPYDSRLTLHWREWLIEPGAAKTIALFHSHYGLIESRNGSSDYNSGFRRMGFGPYAHRILHQASEVMEDPLGPWSNWTLQSPADPDLVPWDRVLQVSLKDALGRTLVNSMDYEFLPADPLAPVPPFYRMRTGTALLHQPAGGGTIRLHLQNGNPPVLADRTIAQTAEVSLTLPEVAPLSVTVRDCNGQPLAGASVGISGDHSGYSQSTGTDGAVGPAGFLPETLQIRAYLPNLPGAKALRRSILPLAGQDNPVVLQFPAFGNLHLTILDVDGRPRNGYTSAYLHRSDVSDGLNQSANNGSVSWQNLEPGSWTLVVRDPRSSGLISQAVTIQSSTTTEASVRLKAPGSLSILVQAPSGQPIPAGEWVRARFEDGSVRWAWTDAQGRALYSPIMPGHVEVIVAGTASGMGAVGAFDVAEGQAQSVSLPIGSASLAVKFQTADGRPLGMRSFKLSGPAWMGVEKNAQLGSDGTAIVTGLPLNVPLTLTYWTFSGLSYLYTDVDGQPFHFSSHGESKTFTGTLPVGTARIRVVRPNGDPVSNAQVRVATSTANPVLVQTSTDAQGLALAEEIPFGSELDIQAWRGSLTASGHLSFSETHREIQLAWPETVALTATVLRANATVPYSPFPSYYSSAWDWSVAPAGEDSSEANYGHTTATWPHLEKGVRHHVTARLALDMSLYGASYGRGGWYSWQAEGDAVPTEADTSITLTLPVLASARLLPKDAKGDPITDLAGDVITAKMASSTNQLLVGKTILWYEAGSMNIGEVLTVGVHTLQLESQRWGFLGVVSITVGADSDGTRISVPVTLPWSRVDYQVRAVAGDGITPLPWVLIEMDLAGQSSRVGYQDQYPWSGAPLTDNTWISGVYWAPAGHMVAFQGTCWSSSGTINAASSPQTPVNGRISAVLRLPVQGVRVRLMDTDGTPVLPFAAENLSQGVWPQVQIGQTVWSAWFGAAPGTSLNPTLFDLMSGLGRSLNVEMPATGIVTSQEAVLPPHAWLDTVDLISTEGQALQGPQLAALQSPDAGLVRPERAAWRKDDQGWMPALVHVSLSADGANQDWTEYDPYWDALPGPANRIRVPLGFTLWATPDDAMNGPTPWGSMEIQPQADEVLRVDMAQTTLGCPWLPTPMRMVDAQDQAIQDQPLVLSPANAAPGWGFTILYPWQDPSEGGLDGDGLLHPILPQGMPVFARTAPEWSNGFCGSLVFTADAGGSSIPVLRAAETCAGRYGGYRYKKPAPPPPAPRPTQAPRP